MRAPVNFALDIMGRCTIPMLLLTIVLSSECVACDSVTLEFNAGYPAANSISRESSELRIERCPGDNRGGEPVDKYFLAVVNIVRSENMDSDWGYPGVDLPFVKLVVQLGERKRVFIVNAYDDGLRFPLYPTDRDASYARGVRGIIGLTMARATARYKFFEGR